VAHVGSFLEQFTAAIVADEDLSAKASIALGGIVPNLLRTSKARPYREVLDALRHMREAFMEKKVHVFGIGGTATLHLAALLGIDSVDSSGWRNRAARGLIQLPGTGDRIVADLGNWRGRRVGEQEQELLRNCGCPPCLNFGLPGLAAGGLRGASHRATHNLWVLLNESRCIAEHLANGTYDCWYRDHLDNTIYERLITLVVDTLGKEHRAPNSRCDVLEKPRGISSPCHDDGRARTLGGAT
jgi:7-cyano-7-deazaguanine tRNA-ribosyltransferase